MDLATKLVQSSDKALLSIHIPGIRHQHWRTEVLREYLAKCSEGRVTDPLNPSRFAQVHTSPFGVRPKGSKGNGG